MIYSHEVEMMCPVAQGANHGPAPIPEEAKWVQAKEVKDISGFTHGVGWCAPQQGACKLSLNVKDGIIQEALVETIGCSGMTHSAAMASEILPGKTILEALNTDLVCDAINTAMRELFLQIVYGRTQSAFSEDGLAIGAGLEDLGKGLRSQVGTMYGTLAKGPRYLEMAEGYVTGIALDENDEIIGYQFVSLGKFTDFIKAGDTPNDAWEKAKGQYRNDALCSHGIRDSSRQDDFRSIEYRPCLRCHQYSNEGIIPSDRIRKDTERVLRRRTCDRSRPRRPWKGTSLPGGNHVWHIGKRSSLS